MAFGIDGAAAGFTSKRSMMSITGRISQIRTDLSSSTQFIDPALEKSSIAALNAVEKLAQLSDPEAPSSKGGLQAAQQAVEAVTALWDQVPQGDINYGEFDDGFYTTSGGTLNERMDDEIMERIRNFAMSSRMGMQGKMAPPGATVKKGGSESIFDIVSGSGFESEDLIAQLKAKLSDGIDGVAELSDIMSILSILVMQGAGGFPIASLISEITQGMEHHAGNQLGTKESLDQLSNFLDMMSAMGGGAFETSSVDADAMARSMFGHLGVQTIGDDVRMTAIEEELDEDRQGKGLSTRDGVVSSEHLDLADQDGRVVEPDVAGVLARVAPSSASKRLDPETAVQASEDAAVSSVGSAGSASSGDSGDQEAFRGLVDQMAMKVFGQTGSDGFLAHALDLISHAMRVNSSSHADHLLSDARSAGFDVRAEGA